MSILLDIKNYPNGTQLDKVSKCGARIDTPAIRTEPSSSQYARGETRPNRQFNTGIQRNFAPNNFRGGRTPNFQTQNSWSNNNTRPAMQIPQVNRPVVPPQQQRQQYNNTRPNVNNQQNLHRYPTRFQQARGGGSVANTMGTRSLPASPVRYQGGY